MVKITDLGYLLKPRNLAFIGAVIAESSLPNTSFGNVQERVQRGLAALAELEKPRLTAEQRAELYTNAENELAQALKEEPDNCDALGGFGRLKTKLGDYKRAIPTLERAADSCNREDALEALISAYIAVRDFGNARKNIDFVLSRNKKSASAHRQLGFIHWLNKEYKKAIAEYQEAAAIDPTMHVVYNNMAAAYEELGDLGNAMKCATQAIKINPNYASAHFELGLVYRKMGKLKDAVSQFGKAVELAPYAGNFVDELNATKAMLRR